MKDKKNTIITIVFVVIFAAAIFGLYFFVRNLSQERARKKAEKDAEPTEIEAILGLDFEKNYPETARTVVKVYNRITAALYNNSVDDATLSSVQSQMRKLFDDELLSANNRTDQFNSLKKDIEANRSAGVTIEDSMVDSAGNAESWTANKKDYYRIISSYTIKRKGTYETTYQEFILRKDDDGHWKILGWRSVDKDGMVIK